MPPRRALPLILLAVAAVLAASRFASCSKPRGNGRNVLLITLDTTRADFFGSYGYPEDTTPNFDALAGDGARFALAISTSAVTPVSHASILTGLNNYSHGLRVLAADGGFRLPRSVPTLTTVLKDAGYRTVAIHSAFPVSGHFGFKAGFDVFESFDVGMAEKGQNIGWDTSAGQRRSDETTELVLKELARTDEPFFMWVHYWDPHDTLLTPPPEFIPADAPRTPEGLFPPGSAIYAAELKYVDHQFGRLVADLKQRGMWDNTIVVVVSDHGEGLEDGLERHGWQFHRILYQEQIHVPLIVRVPGEPAGRVIEDLVRTIDIYPTVLDYLGLESPREVEGASLRELIDGRPSVPRIAYADQINFFDLNASMVRRRPQADFLFCAMDLRWKLIYRPTHTKLSELYDIQADPLELVNLYDEHPGEVRRLLGELARRDGWVTEPFEMDGGGTSAGTREMLANLGYTDDGGGGEGEVLLRWEWVCPNDSHRGAERGPCTTCGGPLVQVGSFDQ